MPQRQFDLPLSMKTILTLWRLPFVKIYLSFPDLFCFMFRNNLNVSFFKIQKCQSSSDLSNTLMSCTRFPYQCCMCPLYTAVYKRLNPSSPYYNNYKQILRKWTKLKLISSNWKIDKRKSFEKCIIIKFNKNKSHYTLLM